jgi:aminoglycoside phosphotransferase (APT) family kinase protein
VVRGRIPVPVSAGRSGLAEWTLEPLLPGASPGGALPDGCVEFLAALHSCGDSPVASLADAASVVAAASGSNDVRSIGERLDAALAAVPRGFGHGDFFAENLLVADGRLTGVVDWDSAGPGRLPLLDAMHLVVTSRFRPGAYEWGAAVVGELLPSAHRDPLVLDLCGRIGLDPEPALIADLVAAYWLDRAASQLRTHAEHWEDRAWIAANVESVARALQSA